MKYFIANLFVHVLVILAYYIRNIQKSWCSEFNNVEACYQGKQKWHEISK